MRTRTRLTTPPGNEPEAELDRAGGERYSPGLAIPHEPRVAGRRRRLLVTLTVLAVLGVLGTVWFQVATRNQDQDPSLAPPVDVYDAGPGADRATTPSS